MNGWIVDLDAVGEPPRVAVVILQHLVKLQDDSHRLWRIVPNASGSWDYVKVTDDDR